MARVPAKRAGNRTNLATQNLGTSPGTTHGTRFNSGALSELQRLAGNQATRRAVDAIAARPDAARTSLQRLCFFPDAAAAAPAQALPPLADDFWMSPLLGVNHALYPDGPTAGAAVEGALGVAGEPTYTGVSAGQPASAGTYEYWYDIDATPNQLKGRPTHDSDTTNTLVHVTAAGYSVHGPVVHKHAADYPNVNADNAWDVMPNTDSPYNQQGGAYDHYLLKPGDDGKYTKFAKKIALKATQAPKKKHVLETLTTVAKAAKV